MLVPRSMTMAGPPNSVRAASATIPAAMISNDAGEEIYNQTQSGSPLSAWLPGG